MAIAATAFLLHAAAATISFYQHAPQPLEYEEIATNLIQGKGFVATHIGGVAYRSICNPLYPMLCAAMYAVAGHQPFYTVLLNCLFAALLCVTVYYIGRRVHERVGFLAAGLTMLHPGIMYYNMVWLHSLSLDAWLFALVVLCAIRLREHASLGRAVTLGVVVGLQALERSIILLALVPVLWWVYRPWVQAGDLRRRAGQSLVITVTALTLLIPWTVRNYIVHKEFVLVMTTTGELLWRGNNPQATGTAFAYDGRPMFAAADPVFRAHILALNELGQQHAFAAEAWRYMRAHPQAVLAGVVNKLKIFWWFSPLSGLLYPSTYLKIYVAYYAIVAVLALFGAAVLTQRQSTREMVVLIFLLFAVLSLGQSFFYVQAKHRWALEPLLLTLSAVAIHDLWKRAAMRCTAKTEAHETVFG